jgi:Na+-transporting NADH:ubiquinone oxidoreductase subunit NqrB
MDFLKGPHLFGKGLFMIKAFFKDARHYQLLFLGSFLLYGTFILGWDTQWDHYIAIFATALLTQLAGIRFLKLPVHSLKSALITTLGLCLLLKANHWSICALAAFLAIASKFFIRVNGKHVFNPGNFGIVATILLTGQAWISPGQWGSGAILLFLVGVLGSAVVYKVSRLDTSFAFLGTLMALQAARNLLYQGWPFDYWLQQFTNGSLLLFTFFMITDPVTTPDHKKARIIWSVLIAIGSFYLSNYRYINGAPIWVLCFIAPLTPLFDKLFRASRFQWLKPTTLKTSH